jgi:hypothetical protein
VSENWVFFIDTNIFLDFYRLNGESAERQLNALEKHSDRLITGDQVRMEFLNNRQKVISKALKDLKAPSQDGVPQILTGLQDAQLLLKNQKEAKARFQKVKRKAELILSDPAHHDQVYKSFNRIFDAKTALNLCRPMKERITIRNLAKKRFILGYPPRKAGDTSIGDSINWEWIIACAQRLDANTHVMIVSRDSDYGCQLDNEYFLNDWLKREFKDRVSRKRKIILTGKLTDALKKMSETVTLEDEKEETKLIETKSPTSLSELFRSSKDLREGGNREGNSERDISGFLAEWIRSSIAKNLEERAAGQED